MKTIKDLGILVKTKYPGQYDHLTDEKVGALVKKKYPDAYSNFFEIETFNKITDLMQFYKPDQGRFKNWWNRGKSESRANLVKVVTEEQRALIEQGAVLQEAALMDKKKMAEFEMFLATHYLALHEIRAKAKLIDAALEEGYSIEDYPAIKKMREETSLGKDKLAHEIELKIEYEREQTENLLKLQNNEYQWKLEIEKIRLEALLEEKRLNTELEVSKHRQLKEIDFEFENKMSSLEARMAEMQNLLPQHLYNVLSRQLSNLHLEYEEAQYLDDGDFKARELKRILMNINALEKQISEREKELF
jgi:hypothetical protein